MPHQLIDVVTPYVAVPAELNPSLTATVTKNIYSQVMEVAENLIPESTGTYLADHLASEVNSILQESQQTETVTGGHTGTITVKKQSGVCAVSFQNAMLTGVDLSTGVWENTWGSVSQSLRPNTDVVGLLYTLRESVAHAYMCVCTAEKIVVYGIAESTLYGVNGSIVYTTM